MYKTKWFKHNGYHWHTAPGSNKVRIEFGNCYAQVYHLPTGKINSIDYCVYRTLDPEDEDHNWWFEKDNSPVFGYAKTIKEAFEICERHLTQTGVQK